MSGSSMRDALVAVDAGLLAAWRGSVECAPAARGLCRVKSIDVEVVAVAAFERVVGLQARPFVLRQFEPVLAANFSRVSMVPKILPQTSFEACILRAILSVQSCGTWQSGQVARTPRAVGEVDGGLQLPIHVVAHLVAAGAELLGVGDFERGVEAAPEHDAGDEAAERQEAEAEVAAGPAERCARSADAAEHRRRRAVIVVLRRVSVRRLDARRCPRSVFVDRAASPSVCGTWHCVQK